MRRTGRKTAAVPNLPSPPEGVPRSIATHRVPFYETDAMGVVHHAQYVHLLEEARILFLDEHDVPYRSYVEQDLHFAVTRIELVYLQAARFDDRIETTVWVEWARGASLGIGYELRCRDVLLASALTEHAMVDGSGRPARIPRERRDNLKKLAARAG